MTKINSPDELPQMIAELKRQRFYGNIHITLQAGHISRIVTEHSQVFRDNSTKGETYNANFNPDKK